MKKTSHPRRFSALRVGLAMAASLLTVAGLPWLIARACPFCDAIGQTFTEQINSFDVAAIARMETVPEAPDDYRLPKAKFLIVDFLRGEEYFREDLGISKEFENVVPDKNSQVGQLFLVMGAGTRHINWTSPVNVSDEVIAYLKKVIALPEKGVERLAFFADHFEHPETIIAADSYDEFARASYEEVLKLGPRLDREKLIGWLKDPEVIRARKRLYYTLLGTCGKPEDIPWLEEVIRSGDRERQSGLDSLVACYLTLHGDQGMPLIEEVFLKNPDVEQLDVFSVITALRFHGTESDKVSRERLVQALRLVLDRPAMADMVIPDLARWNDWSVMERLVVMFKESSSEETRWVRTPIISYLFDCPLEQADAYIEELRAIDPDAVERAETLAEIEYADDWDDEPEEEEKDKSESAEPNPDQPIPPSVPEEKEKGDDDGGKPDSSPAEDKDGSEEKDGDGEQAQVVLRPALPESSAAAEESGTAKKPAVEYVATQGPVYSDMTAFVDRDENTAADAGKPVSPVAQTPPSVPATWLILVGGAGICVLLFGMLWTVLNGWSDRLIV